MKISPRGTAPLGHGYTHLYLTLPEPVLGETRPSCLSTSVLSPSLGVSVSVINTGRCHFNF